MGSVSEQPLRGHPSDGLFTVASLTFGIFYCFFVITHNRHRILHRSVTRRPDSAWLSQQLRRRSPTTLRDDI
ncbi:MAG TPA: hypothetical protein VI320_03785 [Terracidiphilus sp.]